MWEVYMYIVKWVLCGVFGQTLNVSNKNVNLLCKIFFLQNQNPIYNELSKLCYLSSTSRQ